MSTSVKVPEQRLRLHYLDGLRGLASLYVVIVHINRYMGEQVPLFLQLIGKTFRYGSFAVGVFIVLSGYVLMLPIARSSNGTLSGGLWNYLQRRARRILPPYYAAFLFSLLTAVVVLCLIQFFHFQWYESEAYGEFHPFFSLRDVLTHLLLIHDFSHKTLGSINAPLWSVAVECQIYLIFPLLLLPIWRRFGLYSAVLTAFVISLAIFYLSNKSLETTHPWLLTLFAFGMAAAEIGFSKKPDLIFIRKSFPWRLLAVIFFILALITEWQALQLDRWIGDTFCGLAVACLLVECTKLVIKDQKLPLIMTIFESRWAITLAGFSYSLYLTHGVIVTLIGDSLINLHLPQTALIIMLYIFGIPMSLLFAYGFYVIFEKPFMSNFLKKRKVQLNLPFIKK